MIEYYETTSDIARKQNAEMEAVLFGMEDCAPSHAYGPTLRAYHLFHFVTKGRGMVQIGGETFHLAAGDVFLIPAEQVAYYEASRTEPWSYSWAGLTGLRAERYVRQIQNLTPERYVIRGLDTKKYAAAIAKAAVLSGTSTANYFRTEAVLFELMTYFAEDLPGLQNRRCAPSLAEQIRYYMDAKFNEKLSISAVAAHFGIHPNHLSRLFRETFGRSPKQYLLDLKLEKAASMLSETDIPVSLIAETLGFDDPHAFSRQFKLHKGMSPTACRKHASEKLKKTGADS